MYTNSMFGFKSFHKPYIVSLDYSFKTVLLNHFQLLLNGLSL